MGAKAGLCLVLLACLGCRRENPVKGLESLNKLPVPEQTIANFSIESFAEGVRDWTLNAPRADLFETDNRLEVSSPSVRFFENGEPSSTLVAGQGRLQTDTKDLWAWGGVVMTSTQNVKLTSDWVRYDSALDRILSTAPVTVVRGRSVSKGVGWEATPDLSKIIVHQQRIEIDDSDVPRKEKKKGAP